MILQNPFMNPTINSSGKPRKIALTVSNPAPVSGSQMDQSAVGISQRALVATETADDFEAEAVFKQASIP